MTPRASAIVKHVAGPRPAVERQASVADLKPEPSRVVFPAQIDTPPVVAEASILASAEVKPAVEVVPESVLTPPEPPTQAGNLSLCYRYLREKSIRFV